MLWLYNGITDRKDYDIIFMDIEMKFLNGMATAEEIRKVDQEVADHNLIFHMKGEQILTRGAMRDVEEKLKDRNFFRCNKCEMVNLNFVDGIVNNEARVDGTVIQISGPKKKAFLNELNDYMNEVQMLCQVYSWLKMMKI